MARFPFLSGIPKPTPLVYFTGAAEPQGQPADSGMPAPLLDRKAQASALPTHSVRHPFDRFMTYLDEPNVLRLLPETLTADGIHQRQTQHEERPESYHIIKPYLRTNPARWVQTRLSKSATIRSCISPNRSKRTIRDCPFRTSAGASTTPNRATWSQSFGISVSCGLGRRSEICSNNDRCVGGRSQGAVERRRQQRDMGLRVREANGALTVNVLSPES
jgi:hypothetical protein